MVIVPYQILIIRRYVISASAVFLWSLFVCFVRCYNGRFCTDVVFLGLKTEILRYLENVMLFLHYIVCKYAACEALDAGAVHWLRSAYAASLAFACPFWLLIPLLFLSTGDLCLLQDTPIDTLPTRSWRLAVYDARSAMA